jgi:hypothetical protein
MFFSRFKGLKNKPPLGLENPREKRVKRAKTQVLVKPSQGEPPSLHKRRKTACGRLGDDLVEAGSVLN